MNYCISLNEEIFNLILSDKITVFDLDFEVRTNFKEFYVAEFRKSRYFKDRHKTTLKKMMKDIDNVKNIQLKSELIQLYLEYKISYTEPSVSSNDEV
jgi:hypothetical protein